MLIRLYKNRSLRTILLALFATITFVGSAIFIFEVEPMVMFRFFIISVGGTSIMILAALIFTALKVLFNRWLNR